MLKLLVALFAALGIASMLVDIGALKDALSSNTFDTVLILVGWAFPLLMGVLGVMKPPFAAWQGLTALAGFALVAIKLRTWEALPHFTELATRLQLAHVAILGGAFVSLIAIGRPERA
jgi:hypothetical protein